MPQEKFVEIPVLGRTILRCYVDFGFGIVFPAEPEHPVEAELRIEGDFTITEAGSTAQYSPEGPRHLLGPALNLFGKVVEEAKALEDGTLVLCFTDTTELRVPPGGAYETWQFTDSADHKLVSLPSGGLANWNL
jgi:hypothetical protein